MGTEQVKVLIVDDMEHILKRLARIVQSDPRLVLSGMAKNGYEAVAHVAHTPPDVIIMDIEMESKMAGLYASREILKTAPGIRIIMYTQHNVDYYVYKAFQFGVSDYMIKDASDQEIIKNILRAYHNRSIIHAEAAGYLRQEFIRLKNAQENLAYTLQVILKLTQTERDILRLLYSGMKKQEIAKVRFIEMTTMKTHISSILKKFNRRSIAEVLETVESTGFFTLIQDME